MSSSIFAAVEMAPRDPIRGFHIRSWRTQHSPNARGPFHARVSKARAGNREVRAAHHAAHRGRHGVDDRGLGVCNEGGGEQEGAS